MTPGVQVVPWDNRKALTARDRAAALDFGGEMNDNIRIEGVTPRATASARGRIAPETKRAAIDKANADAMAAKRAANLEKARTVQKEMKASELRASKEAKDNGAKIRALESGTIEAADLYKRAHSGPSRQISNVHVGRVRHTPDNDRGEFQITDRGGETVGWATRVTRNGETAYSVHSEGANGEHRLQGWAGELSTAADILTNGEVAARGYGNRNSDSERLSKGSWENYVGRSMSLDELELSAARDAVRRAREDADNPNLTPAARQRAQATLAKREAGRSRPSALVMEAGQFIHIPADDGLAAACIKHPSP